MTFIERLKSFLPLDKMHIDILDREYHAELNALGRIIYEHHTSARCKETDDITELLDFLDGNRFEIKYDESPEASIEYPILIIPIYTPEYEEQLKNEIEKTKQKVREAFEKVQSAVSQYVPVSCEMVYNTSMEDPPRYILEREKLLASWSFWLCICRRVELLQLVPAGRCGSSPIPRPP